MKEYLFHFVFIIYSLLIYKYRIKISTALEITDHPDNIRKSHFSPISATGGFIIFPYILSSLIYLNILSIIKLKILLISAFLYASFFFTGLIDDKIYLSAKSKTFILLFVLFILIPLDKSLLVSYLAFKDINWFILLNQGSLFFTIFCIYFFYNALNFADGLNGIGIILCLYFVLAIMFANNEFNILYLSILISLLFTLIPNLFGKIFLGNSGISFLAILISILFIENYNKGLIFFDEIALIVFLPTLDAIRITIERILNGSSPFNSDRDHFHHLLLNVFDKKYVFLPYIIFAIMPYTANKIYLPTHISFVTFTFVYFLILFFLKKRNV